MNKSIDMKSMLFTVFMVCILTSCVEKSTDYFITFKNFSENEIVISDGVKYPLDSLDGIIYHSAHGDPVLPNSSSKIEFVRNAVLHSWYRQFSEAEIQYAGYLSLFVIDPLKLNDETGSAMYYDKHVILARYDIRRKEMEALNWTVCYPPDERMRKIHMWPSYEDLQEIRNGETIKLIE